MICRVAGGGTKFVKQCQTILFSRFSVHWKPIFSRQAPLSVRLHPCLEQRLSFEPFMYFKCSSSWYKVLPNVAIGMLSWFEAAYQNGANSLPSRLLSPSRVKSRETCKVRIMMSTLVIWHIDEKDKADDVENYRWWAKGSRFSLVHLSDQACRLEFQC